VPAGSTNSGRECASAMPTAVATEPSPPAIPSTSQSLAASSSRRRSWSLPSSSTIRAAGSRPRTVAAMSVLDPDEGFTTTVSARPVPSAAHRRRSSLGGTVSERCGSTGHTRRVAVPIAAPAIAPTGGADQQRTRHSSSVPARPVRESSRPVAMPDQALTRRDNAPQTGGRHQRLLPCREPAPLDSPLMVVGQEQASRETKSSASGTIVREPPTLRQLKAVGPSSARRPTALSIVRGLARPGGPHQ